MEIEFVELVHSDRIEAEWIRQVLFDAYTVEAALIGMTDFPPLRRSAANIQAAQSIFFGCLQTGKLIAVAEIEGEPLQQVTIASFVVHPSCFRRGVGSCLLRHTLEIFDKTPITVSTASQNKPAITLYEKHGFQITKHWTINNHLEMVTLIRNPDAG
ncbi:MAG: GNAT family N-acetyltransferase [Chloroflexota bacterium]